MAIRPSSRLMPSLSFLLSPSRSSSSSPTHLCSLQLPCSGSVSPFVSPSFPHSLATRCPRWGTSLSRSRSLTSQSSSSSSSSAPSSVSPSSLSSPCHSPSSPSSHSAPSSCSFSRSRGHTSLSSGPSWVSSFVLQDASSERKTVFDERKEAALAAIAPSVAPESVALPAASGETLGESVLLPPASFRAPRLRFSQRTSPSHPGKTYESATAAGGETCRGGDGRHRKDRSKKGSVDEEIRPLLDAINKLKNFYTSSSCAGRILLVGTPFENSQEKETVCPSSRSAVPDSAPSLTASSPADKSASPSVFQDVREARAGPRGLEQEAKREERGDRSASQATQTGGKPIQKRNGNDEGAASPEAASEGKRKKHSFVFLLNHHQKVDAHQLLHAVAACPIPCQEIWYAPEEKTSVARTEAALLQTETKREPRRAAAGAECRRGGSEPVSVQTRRDEEEQDERTLTENGGTLCGREDGEKKEAEDQGKEIAERILWERWLTLARLCNQALEESRTRFFELEKQIQKLSQPSLESSSDRPAQQNR
uniref:tRNA(Phe) 7-[(3-amino-3-carboxypropyl)-4-demethylwyosine(37)-N(4)]-methyltransferase n=1 Tax=Toxoplasma gondii (strain ATCC 50861 / VEG) TaxID=432359 RepID=A0A0F7V6N1_TOXGV|nr:TPA: hypothetical protein BN1205_068290 [Toxoplasma gondii VEG]